MKNLTESTVLIIGIGMIGGSIARGLKKFSPNIKILAVDKNTVDIEQALNDKTIDKFGSLEEMCSEADIVLLALPTLLIEELLPKVARLIRPDTVVSDVASVKSHLLPTLRELGEPFTSNFVPAHPIAGSEQSGYAASKDALFKGRNVILTPLVENRSEALSLINDLWRSLGATVLGMSLSRHDEVLAATSHLPHLLAFTIVDVLLAQEKSGDIFRYAAGGFADFSRLASSDAKMWADIFIANSDATERVLDDYIEALQQQKKAIHEKKHSQLIDTFTEAKKARDRFIDNFSKPSERLIMDNDQINFMVKPGGSVSGSVRVPGDKSISHRSIILGSIADGVTHIQGFLEGEDALSTLAAFREMGVTIVGPENGEVTIYGVGISGLKAPRKTLNMGNSGTAMRLMAGLLSAQDFSSELCGDESLSKRPMNRVADPLREMGANISTEANGLPPLRIEGSSLNGIEHQMKIASAQVKSCLLLAGLYAHGSTQLTEPAPCRDHTERMLEGFSYPIERDYGAGTVRLNSGHRLVATNIDVPADISSAAFFMVAAAITPNADITLQHVGVNPTRIGVINILRKMGADIELQDEQLVGGEPVANIRVRHSQLKGIDIPEDQIPLAIDEFPVLFVAAACAEGTTVLRNASELRVKESDRIDAMAEGLSRLGVELETFDDGIRIEGGAIGGGVIDSHGDHRIAMAFAIAALRADSSIEILNCANVATSFPGFVELSSQLGIQISMKAGD